jgi:hypothetical protein
MPKKRSQFDDIPDYIKKLVDDVYIPPKPAKEVSIDHTYATTEDSLIEELK